MRATRQRAVFRRARRPFSQRCLSSARRLAQKKVLLRPRQPGQSGGTETMKKLTTGAKAPRSAVPAAPKPRKPKAARVAARPRVPSLAGRGAGHRSDGRHRPDAVRRPGGRPSRWSISRTPRLRRSAPAPAPVARADKPDPPAPLDRLLHAGLARYTMGLSPMSSGRPMPTGRPCPGFARQAAAACAKGVRKAARFGTYAASARTTPPASPIQPLPAGLPVQGTNT